MNSNEKPTVIIRIRGQEQTVRGVTTVGEALEALQIPPELFLVLREGILLDLNTPLNDGDVLQLIGVISGGATEQAMV
ncbi:MAG: MoaD/ThiS family protein [Anaerolinea sp.]|jgi:sulfur carrier protein ThiS